MTADETRPADAAADDPAPIDPGLFLSIPPSEWEFHTVLGARPGGAGCALLPGDMGPVVVRRRVTYGPWEPVRPDHWAEPAAGQGGCDEGIDTTAQSTPYHTPAPERPAEYEPETAQCPREEPHSPHMWTWQEDGHRCPGRSERGHR